jgi:hypothetical protein
MTNMAPEVYFRLEQVPATSSQSRWGRIGNLDDALHNMVYPGGYEQVTAIRYH